MASAPSVWNLRELPLPARWVLTCFLLAVGIGYGAALVQLHVQDAASGTLLPTVADVVLKYTGKRWFDAAPPRPVSQLEKLIMGPVEGAPWNGTGSMAAAFFHKDGAGFKREYERADDAAKQRLWAEREGERTALRLWIQLPDEQRRASYEHDRFVPPPQEAPSTITPDYRHDDGAIRVRSILNDRCVRCHGAGSEQENFPLETYEQIAKYLEVPVAVEVPPGGGWVRVQPPISIEKLAQTTHAHWLSFSILFAATGLIFALTGYPLAVRCVLAPLTLLAFCADISLWWLARLSEQSGPYWAMLIPLTGGIAGLSLLLQIVLSLYALHGRRGQLIVSLILAAILAIAATIYTQQIAPAIQDKQQRAANAQQVVQP